MFVFLLVTIQEIVDILLLESTLPPMRDINHHDLDPLGPKLQHVGGVLSSPTRSTNLIFLYFGPALKEE